MNLQKSHTKKLQGIAILFMLGLHLFNRTNVNGYYNVHLFVGGGTPLLTYISYIFDACVPIYLFCSGYGLYTSTNQNSGNAGGKGRRILKLLLRFWVVLGLTCVVGYLSGMKDVYPGSFVNFMLNVCLVKNSYVGTFWFVQTYVLLVLLSGWIFRSVKKYSFVKIFMVSFVIYCVSFGIGYFVLGKISIEPLYLCLNAGMLLFRSQFSFVIGAIFAQENIIDRSKWITRIRRSRVFPWAVLVLIVMIRGSVARHMIFAPFSACVLILLFGTYDWGNFGEKVLLFLGKHSTNMWLTHMQFYMIFTPGLVFGSRNVFVIMLTLVVLSLAASGIVDIIYHNLEKFLSRIIVFKGK